MLTKDLVRYRIRGKRLHPEFLDPGDSKLRQLSEALLAAFRESEGKSRTQLETESKLIVDASTCGAVIARGLEKLLFDRVDFATPLDDDLLAWRHQLFLQTSQLLSSEESFPSVDAFRQAAARTHDQGLDELTEKLFSDLPENQPVERFRSLSAERLLHRYNAALVQWLLLHSHGLTLTTRRHDTKAWRQFFRHLRFRQLLAEIQGSPTGECTIRVDGPLSLFEQTKKYGLALATFFPAVLPLPEWKLEAEIHLPRRKAKRLILAHQAGLRPYVNHFLAHIPGEITLFETLFKERVPTWTLRPGEDFITLPGDAYGFPDFTAVHPSGITAALELFHRWHGGPLKDRLTQLKSDPPVPLLIGVERRLAKHPEVATLLQGSAYFNRWGFLFRDMPSPDAVGKRLQQLLEAPPS